LRKSRSYSPKVNVVCGGQELGLDFKGEVGVNHRTTWTVSTGTVLGLALLAHGVHALGNGITSSVGARVCGHLVTEWIFLHDVDAWAHWFTGLRVLRARAVVHFYSINSSDTSTGKLRQVNIVGERATNHPRFVSIVLAVEGRVLDKYVIVGANIELSVQSCCGSRPVLRSIALNIIRTVLTYC